MNSKKRTVSASEFRPADIHEAVRLLRLGYKPVAGGTDLLLRRHAVYSGSAVIAEEVRTKAENPVPLFFTGSISGTDKITKKDEHVSIGCSVTLTEIIKNKHCPEILRESLLSIAAPGIRNTATLAGNICNASPAADSIPALYVLGASAAAAGTNGDSNRIITREIGLKELITGPGRTSLGKEELITSIDFRKPGDNFQWYFRKVGTRAANALTKISIAAGWYSDGEILRNFRLAVGACGPTIISSVKAEELIEGLDISSGFPQGTLSEILEMYSESISPIDDQRSSAVYRKRTALRLIKSLLFSMGGVDDNP